MTDIVHIGAKASYNTAHEMLLDLAERAKHHPEEFELCLVAHSKPGNLLHLHGLGDMYNSHVIGLLEITKQHYIKDHLG